MSGEAFAVERLREDPDLDYAALRRVADAAGITMQPIQYGRARKQLGLPPLAAARAESRAGDRQTAVDDDMPEARSDEVEDREGATDDDVVDDRDDAPARDEDEQGQRREPDEGAESAGEPAGQTTQQEPAAADIVAPRRKGSPAFDFLVQELRRDGTLNYGTLRERAEARGFKIAPIMYGRAKAVLGLVPVKARGQGAKKAAAAAAGAPRVLKQVESVAADRFSQKLEEVRSLDQLVSVVKDLDAERRRLRGLLERIVAMIDEALG
jgi:hypothetical protein